MKTVTIAGCAAALLLGGSPAQAGDEFETAFKYELGRIAAHEAAHVGKHLLGLAYVGVSHPHRAHGGHHYRPDPHLYAHHHGYPLHSSHSAHGGYLSSYPYYGDRHHGRHVTRHHGDGHGRRHVTRHQGNGHGRSHGPRHGGGHNGGH